MERKIFIRMTLAALLFCLFGLSRGIADEVKPSRSVAVVPFTLGSDGRMYVQGRINDQTQATFLIDTGTDDCYLSSTLADKLHLPIQTVTEDGTEGGKPVLVGGQDLKSINISSTVLGNQSLKITANTFALLPESKLPPAPLPAGHVDGIIGSRFLGQCALLLDFSRNNIVVYYPGGFTPSEMNDFTAANYSLIYTIPILPSAGDPYRWVTHVQFENGTITAQEDLMVDTGANRTTISDETAKQLKLVDTDNGTATLFLNRKAAVHVSQVTKMQVGDLVLFNRSVMYPEKPVTGYPVSLGMDLLRGYIPLIDFAQNKIFVFSAGMGVRATPKK